MEIRPDVLAGYGFILGKTPFYTYFTAVFLHADPFHLLGNMLFLWVFGPSVEDRLGVGRFLGMYFLSGFIGDLMQAGLGAAEGRYLPGIGASGCIAGLLGAYWYMFSWSTVCVFYWIGWLWHGVWEVAAGWVVGLFFAKEVLFGYLMRSAGQGGGVANFAHVGGVLGGLLICLALRAKRDSSELSEARAIQADMKDLSLMPLHALQTMLESDPLNTQLIRAMVKPAYNLNKVGVIHDAMARAGTAMIEADPTFVAYYLTTLRGESGIYQPVQLLRLAGVLERAGEASQALQVYSLISQRDATSQDAETALYKMANCYWTTFHDVQNARNCLREMATRFPNGPMTPYGRNLWNQIK
jgi:membrane associated rhomboid family serine protease